MTDELVLEGANPILMLDYCFFFQGIGISMYLLSIHQVLDNVQQNSAACFLLEGFHNSLPQAFA